MNDYSEKAAHLFKILSVKTRVRLLELLKCRSLCVNALSRELGITPAAVSQHLRILRSVGAVKANKKGYFVHYSVNVGTLKKWDSLLKRIFTIES